MIKSYEAVKIGNAMARTLPAGPHRDCLREYIAGFVHALGREEESREDRLSWLEAEYETVDGWPAGATLEELHNTLLDAYHRGISRARIHTFKRPVTCSQYDYCIGLFFANLMDETREWMDQLATN